MDSLAATSLFSILNFIIFIFISSVSTDQINITAQSGQDTFLPCRSPDNKPVLVLEWRRSDLGSEYLLLYRNDQLDLENQHVMFKDRVDLQDRQMKDGNVSLVLKNVTTDDRGAYECRIVQTETNSQRKTITITIINLDVLTSPGEPDGGNRVGPTGRIYLVISVVVPLVVSVTLGISGIFVYRKHKKPACGIPKSNHSSEGPLQAQQPLTGQNQPAD